MYLYIVYPLQADVSPHFQKIKVWENNSFFAEGGKKVWFDLNYQIKGSLE